MSRFLTCLLSVVGENFIAAKTKHRLSKGWEFYQGILGSPWEVWHGDASSDNVALAKVTLPHGFNRSDAVDPDVPYY